MSRAGLVLTGLGAMILLGVFFFFALTIPLYRIANEINALNDNLVKLSVVSSELQDLNGKFVALNDHVEKVSDMSGELKDLSGQFNQLNKRIGKSRLLGF